MTTLSIYPKFGDKTAKITGTVSAGEHVDVRIVGGASLLPSSTLRLRITCGKTIAVFPQPESNDAWATEGSDLKCHLNLNTVQAEIALRHGCVSCHALLEQTADDEHILEPTLFFDDEFDILPWRKIPGETTPLNLDAYPDVIASFERRINEFGAVVNQTKDLVTQAKNAAVGANNRAGVAESAARGAERSALAAQRALDGINSQVADARNAAVRAKSSASAASDSAAVAKEKADVAAEKAGEAAQSAAEAVAGLANKADLVGGKVPASQLPPFDDDVLEYPSASQFPAVGRTGRIYVATDKNEMYRWNGTAYVKFFINGTLTGNGFALYPAKNGGDGKWHKVIIENGALAYDSVGLDAPPGEEYAAQADLDAEIRRATEAEQAKVPTDGDHTINGVKTFSQSPLVPTIQSTDENSKKAASTGWVVAKITAWWNATKSTVTFAKSQVGLGDVDNTSDAEKPVSTETQTALNLKADDNAVVKLEGNQEIYGRKTFKNTARFEDGLTLKVSDSREGEGEGATESKSISGLLNNVGCSYLRFVKDGGTKRGEVALQLQNPWHSLRLRSIDANTSELNTNVTKVVGSAFAAAGMPSESYVDGIFGTIDASGEFGVTWKSNYSGWIYIFGQQDSSVRARIKVEIRKGSTILFQDILKPDLWEYFTFIIPISKDQTVAFISTGKVLSVSAQRFYKSNAEVV